MPEEPGPVTPASVERPATSQHAGTAAVDRSTTTEPPAAALPVEQPTAEEYAVILAELERLRKGERKAVRKRRLERQLKPYQVELIKLQNHLERHHQRMIVLFEGRDAAGKGGTIRRVTRFMNEKHYRVVALGKPTEEQRTQWYYQRYVAQFPRGGEIVLFDRSWYNRAMVEPVFGFCADQEYDQFMKGVVGFEKDLVRTGTVLVKLYFSVDKDEQKRRFDRRRDDPLRQWKLSEVDLQAQENWEEFTAMKYEMLKRTSTSQAPWTVIRSENKHQARLNAMRVMLNAVDYEDRATDVDFVPDPEVVLSGPQELALMEADRIRGGQFTS
jgi:polyphosphate kinase 2